MQIVASIQARLGSTRLPGKVLFHLGDRRVLQWVVDRTDSAETVDRTVVTLGDGPENDAIQEYCHRAGIDCRSGPEEDLLARHLDVATETDCDLLVRITGDCPFVPSDEIDRIVRAHLDNDARYTTNVTDDMPVGTAVDAIDITVLEELRERDETHPVRLPRDDPDTWDVTFTPSEPWLNVSDAHVAVDTPEDYWTLVDAIDAVGPQPIDVAQWVAER